VENQQPTAHVGAIHFVETYGKKNMPKEHIPDYSELLEQRDTQYRLLDDGMRDSDWAKSLLAISKLQMQLAAVTNWIIERRLERTK
jgi:hypothetical protein